MGETEFATTPSRYTAWSCSWPRSRTSSRPGVIRRPQGAACRGHRGRHEGQVSPVMYPAAMPIAFVAPRVSFLLHCSWRRSGSCPTRGSSGGSRASGQASGYFTCRPASSCFGCRSQRKTQVQAPSDATGIQLIASPLKTAPSNQARLVGLFRVDRDVVPDALAVLEHEDERSAGRDVDIGGVEGDVVREQLWAVGIERRGRLA